MDVFLLGAYAALRLGPGAANLMGARTGSTTVVEALRLEQEQWWDQQQQQACKQGQGQGVQGCQCACEGQQGGSGGEASPSDCSPAFWLDELDTISGCSWRGSISNSSNHGSSGGTARAGGAGARAHGHTPKPHQHHHRGSGGRKPQKAGGFRAR